jgi:hypothetical protein
MLLTDSLDGVFSLLFVSFQAFGQEMPEPSSLFIAGNVPDIAMGVTGLRALLIHGLTPDSIWAEKNEEFEIQPRNDGEYADRNSLGSKPSSPMSV